MSLIGYGNMTKHWLVFALKCRCPYAFPGMQYQDTSVGFIFLTIPKLGKEDPAFLRYFCYTHIPMFSGHHLMPKGRGSGGIAWLLKQQLVGTSRKDGISWKSWKTWNNWKNLKNKTLFTCPFNFSEFWYFCQFSCFSMIFNWFCRSYSLTPTIVFMTRWYLFLTDWWWSIKPLPNLIWRTGILLAAPTVSFSSSGKYGVHQTFL